MDDRARMLKKLIDIAFHLQVIPLHNAPIYDFIFVIGLTTQKLARIYGCNDWTADVACMVAYYVVNLSIGTLFNILLRSIFGYINIRTCE